MKDSNTVLFTPHICRVDMYDAPGYISWLSFSKILTRAMQLWGRNNEKNFADFLLEMLNKFWVCVSYLRIFLRRSSSDSSHTPSA